MKIDILFSLKDFIVGGYARALENVQKALEKEGIEVVINDYSLDADIIHVFVPLIIYAPIMKLARKMGKKIVLHLHSLPEDSFGGLKVEKTQASYLEKTIPILIKESDAVITPTEYAKSHIVKKKWAPAEKIFVISNGVDLDKFNIKRKIRVERAVVGNVSTVLWRKRPDIFANTAKINKEDIFIWYGKIFDKNLLAKGEEIHSIIEKRPANLIFFGPINEILDAYKLIDIFMSTSDIELEGIPPLEAAAAGIPLVLRDRPFYREKFEGAALFADNAEEFARAIDKIKRDSALRNKLRRKAKKIAKKYDIKNLGKNLLKVYESL